MSRHDPEEYEGKIFVYNQCATCWSGRCVPTPLTVLCYANAAFANIQGGEMGNARELLWYMLSQLRRGVDIDALANRADLPGVGIWVERSLADGDADQWTTLEEPLESAANLVSRVSQSTTDQNYETALVQGLYQRAVS